MRRLFLATALVGLALTVRASSAGGEGCHDPAGGRCAGPRDISSLTLTAHGRTLQAVVMCGGFLVAQEDRRRVVLTYYEPEIAPGARLCAMVPLAVHLRAPLGSRVVLDGVSHAPIAIAPG